ncbi:MAG TPA: sugar phosphate isomerase/epimerase [Chloroflexota bacterium]
MRVGLDGFAIPGRPLDPFETLAWVSEQGLDGYFFGLLTRVSPTLDPGYLGELRARADDLGLYLEVGVGTVNPTRFASSPAVLALGDGQYRPGFERLLRAGRAFGGRELRVDMGGPAARFDSGPAWVAQLDATRDFLLSVAPLCRDLDCRLDVETHADATTRELAWLVEEVGPDVAGVCLDTANVLCLAEEPVAAAGRVAPYVHQTHAKDAIVYRAPEGLVRQSRPCGDGCVDWPALLGRLAEPAPDLNLSIEDHRGIFAVRAEPGAPELAALEEMARRAEARVARGELIAPDAWESIPWEEHALARLSASVGYLRGLLERGRAAGWPA